MSEAPAAPAAPAPEAAPQDAPAPDAGTDLRGRIQGALKRRAGMSATEQAAPAEEAPAEAAPPAPESTPEPEVNPFEVDRDKALADAARAKAASRDTERRYRELEGRFKELETTQAAWKEDPYAAAQEAGGTLKGWADKVADGEEALTPEQQRVAALEAKLDAIDADKAKATEAAQTAEHEATVTRELDHIQKAAEADSERFGIVDAMGLTKSVHARFYEKMNETGEAPALDDVMAEVAGDAISGLRTIAASDAGIRALLADEATAQKLREALGVTAAAPDADDDSTRDDELAQQADGATNGGSTEAPVLTQSTASTPGRRALQSRTDEQRRRGSRRAVRRMQERMG